MNAFLLETDDVGAGLERSKLYVEQIVGLIANLTQLRHAARGRYCRLHVQRRRTCSRAHTRKLQTAA